MKEKISLTGIVTSITPETEYHCKLTIDPVDGISLHVYSGSNASLHHKSRLDYIHCFMEDGTWWTLLNLHSFSFHVSRPGLSVVEYEALWAIKKASCDSLEDAKIYEATVKIEGLSEWLNKSGFHDHEFGMEDKASIKYTKPDNILLMNLDGKAEVFANFYFTDN